jgi:acetyltransferase-like isoleucine patch superfamily enzyme
MPTFIHPTAIIEENVQVGAGTRIWDHVHIRHSTRIGEQCIVGEKTYIAYKVHIGHRVKINAFVYICTAVTIEDGVMVSAGTIFTNDRFPRATTPDLRQLRSSEPDEHTLPTLVRQGATIGAGSTIGNDLVIGRFAMVGMGSLVTRSVPDFHLVVGNPARSVGCVCRCGQVLFRFVPKNLQRRETVACTTCGLTYEINETTVTETTVSAHNISENSSPDSPPSIVGALRDAR